MTINVNVDKKALLVAGLIGLALYAPIKAYKIGFAQGYKAAINKMVSILEAGESAPKTSDEDTHSGSTK